ncbi:MAG: hypothetical protein IPP57_08680 [Candidatus Obscuribacter sp.]|nr:hypothetical protein [Candidatus Obscuribacter sp.]
MIGTSQIATVVAQANSRDVNDASLEPNGVLVNLPDGVKGFLHISRMIGREPEDRAATLANLKPDTQVEVDVISETTIDGAPGFRVNQWSVVRRARRAAAEQMMTRQTVIKGEVRRVDEQYAIINLIDDVQGLLHVSRALGDSDEEKAARVASLTPGDVIHVRVTDVSEVNGRTRVRLRQLG